MPPGHLESPRLGDHHTAAGWREGVRGVPAPRLVAFGPKATRARLPILIRPLPTSVQAGPPSTWPEAGGGTDGARSFYRTNAGEHLGPLAAEAPGLNGEPDADALAALVAAGADLTPTPAEAAVPGWDAAAGVAAGRRFLATP